MAKKELKEYQVAENKFVVGINKKLRLTERQYSARKYALKFIKNLKKEGLYEVQVLQPIMFKRGEIIIIEDDLSKAEKNKLIDVKAAAKTSKKTKEETEGTEEEGGEGDENVEETGGE